MSYVYIFSKVDRIWVVGFYSPDGEWHPDSDFANRNEASARVHYLNGGSDGKN